jgi:transcriptional regulator with AAA-type ATPase domain
MKICSTLSSALYRYRARQSLIPAFPAEPASTPAPALQENYWTHGESNNFLEVLEQVSKLAPLEKPVLVIGERGTGNILTILEQAKRAVKFKN